MTSAPRTPDLEELIDGVRRGDRQLLARAITLTESQQEAHSAIAQAVLQALLPRTGNSIRVGVTGVPGVGKSTFIDALGTRLVARGHRVAVLAVDPSSQRTGGSILGDKTRMEQLSRQPNAFIRPSPARGAAGGVAPRTREALLLCEAAGFDVVLVETIGVGQSELAVAQMVDTFVLLALAGAGDELQGIKRGVMELADVLVIHKADGDNLGPVSQAQRECQAALRLLAHGRDGWAPPVLTCSSRTGDGLDAVWDAVLQHRAFRTDAGIEELHRAQALQWFEALVAERVQRAFFAAPEVAAALPALRAKVRSGELQPTAAATELLRRHRPGG